MRNFDLNVFKRVFAQTTNDFSVAGSRLLSDGSGETNFRASHFEDNMNGGTVNTHNWRVIQSGNATVTPVVGKSIKLYGFGVADVEASIKLKGSYGRINETGFIKFSLKVKPNPPGIAMRQDTGTGESLFFGMYFDENNRIGVVSRDNSGDGDDTFYHLITVVNGIETKSASFVITPESATAQTFDIIMSLDNVELYINDVLTATNTTNVPNNAELRPYARIKTPTGGGDSFIDIDFIKIDQ